jgi:hypothetical protein
MANLGSVCGNATIDFMLFREYVRFELCVVTVKNNRADTGNFLSSDARCGFAILAMLLSGQLPFHTNTLPDWMYHAQVPPPDHTFIPTLSGIP